MIQTYHFTDRDLTPQWEVDITYINTPTCAMVDDIETARQLIISRAYGRAQLISLVANAIVWDSSINSIAQLNNLK